MSTATAARPATSALGRTLLVGLLAGLTAGVANVVVFFLSQAIFGLPYLMPMGGPGSTPVPLPFVAVIISCVIPALLAAVLYWALGRFTRRATTIFVGLAVAFTLLSLFPSLSLPPDLGTRLGLSFMHLVAAPIITLGLTRYAPQS